MPNDVILKKLEQMTGLLDELERLLAVSSEEFGQDMMRVRAAERNFQLVVDLAVDINTQFLLERGEKTPDTYRQSFSGLVQAGILEQELARRISASAGLRNILVHEYDFEEDYARFYDSAKKFIAPYREYMKTVFQYIREK